MKKSLAVFAAVPLCLALVGAGCSTTMGRFVPNSQFAYPNSNVTVLGPVQAQTIRTSFFSAPDLGLQEVKDTYHRALSQVSGANILVNFREDSTLTSYVILPIYTIRYRLEGEAARMDVGQQVLK